MRTTTKKADSKAKNVETTTDETIAAVPAEESKTTKKAAAKKDTAKKETTKKATATKKTTAATTKRTTRKKAAPEINQEVYIQFWGKEVYAKEVVDRIKNLWVEEMGKKPEELLDLKVYIKPEENGAHYVINGEITGFIGL